MLSLKIKDFINKVQDNVLIPELEKTVSRQVSSKEKHTGNVLIRSFPACLVA